MQNVYLLVKPASGRCQLRCGYCFYRDETLPRQARDRGFMTLSTLEAVVREGLGYAGREVTFAFQGGEPTLAGLPFFEAAVRLQKQYNTRGVKVNNTLQTNGLLLDGAWAAFLRENGFLVGLSLDGVAATHNANRPDAAGQGTFARTLQAAKLLQAHNVEFNILTVVNRQTAEAAAEIYGFYKAQGFSWLQFIPCLDPVGEAPGGHAYSLSPADYGRFLTDTFDLWYRDVKRGAQPFIRQFENYVGMLLGLPPEACGMRGVCGLQHAVEADGSVYPCDFYVTDALYLGNLNENTLAEINARRVRTGFVEASAFIHERCRACRWFPLCRGGCRRCRPPDESGRPGLNIFCESYRTFFAHAIEGLTEIADGIR